MVGSRVHPEGSSSVRRPTDCLSVPGLKWARLGRPGHVTPEAQLGGPLALVKDGDRIVVDATTRQIDWLVDNETKEARRKEWEMQGKRDLKVKRGVLYRYARDVAVSGRFFTIMAFLRTDPQPANLGAFCD